MKYGISLHSVLIISKNMYWDYISGIYDIFANYYNGKVNTELCKIVVSMVSVDDEVLECGCGTGMISSKLADRCSTLIATDFSDGMLVKTKKKCNEYANVKVEKANIENLQYPDESFDKVVAANVIHLLDNPEKALGQLMRVCRKGGTIIIPTYIVKEEKVSAKILMELVNFLGAKFRMRFNEESYKQFFVNAGINNVSFFVVDGRVSCDIAVIRKKE